MVKHHASSNLEKIQGVRIPVLPALFDIATALTLPPWRQPDPASRCGLETFTARTTNQVMLDADANPRHWKATLLGKPLEPC